MANAIIYDPIVLMIKMCENKWSETWSYAIISYKNRSVSNFYDDSECIVQNFIIFPVDEIMLSFFDSVFYRIFFKQLCSRLMENNIKISIAAEVKLRWRVQASLKSGKAHMWSMYTFKMQCYQHSHSRRIMGHYYTEQRFERINWICFIYCYYIRTCFANMCFVSVSEIKFSFSWVEFLSLNVLVYVFVVGYLFWWTNLLVGFSSEKPVCLLNMLLSVIMHMETRLSCEWL